jgi:triacylglycerol lipase
MSLADPTTGLTTHQNAAGGVSKLVGMGTVVVVGHSLGSALATYFTDDLAERLGSRVSACLFASPRTGDSAWARLFAANVKDYRLFNYMLDIVTHVPTFEYATLPNATVIQPSTAQAGIRLDLFCDHHVICYCAMIDYKDTMAAPTTAQDATSKSCILPPPSAMPETAKARATIINEFGVGDQRTLVMLKALHTVNTI